MKHTCHARDCRKYCPPEHLMCNKHWSLVHPLAQKWVLETYRKGQCDDKQPSSEWFVAADTAIAYVGLIEGKFKNATSAIKWIDRHQGSELFDIGDKYRFRASFIFNAIMLP